MACQIEFLPKSHCSFFPVCVTQSTDPAHFFHLSISFHKAQTNHIGAADFPNYRVKPFCIYLLPKAAHPMSLPAVVANAASWTVLETRCVALLAPPLIAGSVRVPGLVGRSEGQEKNFVTDPIPEMG